jgi:hypothetical protein
MRLLVLFGLILLVSCKSKEPASNSVKAPESKAISTTDIQDKQEGASQRADEEDYDPKKAMQEMGIGPRDYPDSIVIGIERTSCVGTCPSYEILVSQNGYVSYNGMAFIEPEGKHYSRISKEDVLGLTILSERFGYSGLEEAYWQPITDVPITYTTVLFEGNRKSILNQSEAPQNLIDFEKELDAKLLKLDWIKIEE